MTNIGVTNLINSLYQELHACKVKEEFPANLKC